MMETRWLDKNLWVQMFITEYYCRERGGEPIHLVMGKYPDYDFMYVSQTSSGEIKIDWRGEHSLNIAVEVESHGEPSGLVTTKSTLWIHAVPRGGNTFEVFEFNVDTLREAIEGVPEVLANRGECRVRLLPQDVARRIARRTFALDVQWPQP